MDVKILLEEAKARFNQNSLKDYLREKYSSKLLVAEYGGLWRADVQTISFLSSITDKKTVLIDTFNNPVEVECKPLLKKLKEVYKTTMDEYYKEFKELENKR